MKMMLLSKTKTKIKKMLDITSITHKNKGILVIGSLQFSICCKIKFLVARK